MKNSILKPGILVILLMLAFTQATGQTHTIILESNPEKAAYSLQGGGIYSEGELVEVFAEGYEGWGFDNWTENGVVVSSGQAYSFVATRDRHLVANFINQVNFSSSVESLDFGEVPVGQCSVMEYMLINNPPLDRILVTLEIIAPEGFQTVNANSYPGFADYADTTYHNFYLFYGEVYFVRFCPVEQAEYSGYIQNIHPGTDTLFLPVSGTGTPPEPYLDLTVILEGAHTPGQEYLMHTTLTEYSVLPALQPFGPSLPWYQNPEPLWYYTGDELLGPPIGGQYSSVVDWVLVELRDAPSASEATPNTVIHRQAALLLNTGKIINHQGIPLYFSQEIQNDLFIVVYHRNHIPVMSSGPLTPVGGSYSWDFTSSGAAAYNSGQKHLGAGVYGMYGGDGDGNGQVQNQDKNNVWEPQAGLHGYLPGDFNLDGQVQTQDVNNIWEFNGGIATQVPQ